LINYDGERYLTANEVAKRFNLSWGTCSSNLLPQMQECHLPGRKRVFYRLSDVEQFSQVRVIEKVPCKEIPASTIQAETGSHVQFPQLSKVKLTESLYPDRKDVV
jgi:hypothetical protein